MLTWQKEKAKVGSIGYKCGPNQPNKGKKENLISKKCQMFVHFNADFGRNISSEEDKVGSAKQRKKIWERTVLGEQSDLVRDNSKKWEFKVDFAGLGRVDKPALRFTYQRRKSKQKMGLNNLGPSTFVLKPNSDWGLKPNSQSADRKRNLQRGISRLLRRWRAELLPQDGRSSRAHFGCCSYRQDCIFEGVRCWKVGGFAPLLALAGRLYLLEGKSVKGRM